MKKDVDDGLEFYDGRRPTGMRKALAVDEMPDARTIREMQQRIDYLEQEMEFLKKISSARTTRK